jgi:hypothetical protein
MALVTVEAEHAVRRGGERGCGRVDLGAAMQFGHRDPAQTASEQAWQPTCELVRNAVASQQFAVTDRGRVVQVEVVVAADELHQCLQHRMTATATHGGGYVQGAVAATGEHPLDLE